MNRYYKPNRDSPDESRSDVNGVEIFWIAWKPDASDGLQKQMAVEASRSSLEDAIRQWESKNGVAAVDVKAAKPVPRPYWRSSVRPFLVLTPDEMSDRAYTICWQGVISPVVCTSGAEVCW